MRADEIRKAQKAEPFRPYWVRLADGREYHVPHPEFLIMTQDGRTIVVIDKDDSIDILDGMLITALHFDKPSQRRNGKGPGGKRKSA
jgi:hypothetical protein